MVGIFGVVTALSTEAFAGALAEKGGFGGDRFGSLSISTLLGRPGCERNKELSGSESVVVTCRIRFVGDDVWANYSFSGGVSFDRFSLSRLPESGPRGEEISAPFDIRRTQFCGNVVDILVEAWGSATVDSCMRVTGYSETDPRARTNPNYDVYCGSLSTRTQRFHAGKPAAVVWLDGPVEAQLFYYDTGERDGLGRVNRCSVSIENLYLIEKNFRLMDASKRTEALEFLK